MLPIPYDIEILRGVTWNPVLQWLSEASVHKPISGVVLGLPTTVTAVAHGLTSNNRAPVWITDVDGPDSLNTGNGGSAKPRWATVVDADTISIDFDSASFAAYRSGGVLTYQPPVDLTGWTASQKIYDAVGGNLLYELNTKNGGIMLGADGTISRVLTADASAALALVDGWYKLELTDTNGVVTRVVEGAARIADSVQD